MTLDTTSAAWATGALAFAATWILARVAPRLGWRDAGDGVRKPQRTPLAPVGGAALAAAWIAAWALGARWPGEILGLEVQPAAALALAFCVGLADDLVPRGLRPTAKLAGQGLAALALVAPELARGASEPARLAAGLGLACAALVAMNALNTWDNADGAAAGLGLLALAGGASPFGPALIGFLPCNLRRRDGRALLAGLPRAILGDAGSHLLGMALVLSPATWPALALPLADLARVAWERVRAGAPPWVGDRRHLAHRLERRGLAPWAVAAALALAVLPAAWPAGRAVRAGAPLEAALWTLATLALGAAAAASTRNAGRACRGTSGPG